MQEQDTSPDPHYDLEQALELVQDCIRQVSMSANTNPEQRDAVRYLFERIINYKGLMRKRRLTASIEFLVPYHDGKLGCTTAGWYFRDKKIDENGRVASGSPSPSHNWHGPYGSHKLAILARDKDKPATKVALSFSQLDQMASD